MPMRALSVSSLRRARRLAYDIGGSIAVEAAILIPMFVIIVAGGIEVARAYQQANALEKGLRVGALYLARSEDPEDGAAQVGAANLVRTGQIDGTGDYLAPGWSEPTSTVTVSVRDYSLGNNDNTSVIRIEAALLYTPILPNLAHLFGLDATTIRMSHEQAYVGF